VIPEGDLDSWRARSPFNVVRLIRPGDDYQGAARVLSEWLSEGVLAEDTVPAMYLHQVEVDGRARRDLVAAVRLQPYDDAVVLPHERTHRGPKEDRLALLQATGMSLEPLWFLYRGRGTRLRDLVAAAAGGEPVEEFQFDGERHRLWRIEDGGWCGEVSAALGDLQLLIADGHHRYETALAYAAETGGPEDAASRFTLGLLTDIDEPGLRVLATHRVLRRGIAVTGGEPAPSLEAALAALEGRTAAVTYRDGAFQVLPLEGEVAVAELHRQVLDNILGSRTAEESLLYTRDPAEAVGWVDAGLGVSAFMLGPPDLHAVLGLAEAGRLMPQKSTYFEPKPPSGMLFHRLDPNRPL
jgi:uncharacterized protein (DUF1015 family)